MKLGDQMVDKKEADFPILSDPTKATATAYGVLNDRGSRIAGRSTSEGRQDPAIDKAVKPETSAQDMAAKLKELGVPSNSESAASVISCQLSVQRITLPFELATGN